MTQHHFIKIPHFGRVHYALEGEDPHGKFPLVVLIHGITSSVASLQALRHELCKRSRISLLSIDFCGHGFTDEHATGPLCGKTVIVFYDLVLKCLGLYSKQFHIVAHSMGAAIASVLISSRRFSVKSVCLLSPYCGPTDEPFSAKLARTPLLNRLLMRLAGPRLVVRHFTTACPNPITAKEVEESLLELFEQRPEYLYTFFNLFINFLSQDFLRNYQEFPHDCAVMIIHGTLDKIVPEASVKKLRSVLTDKTVIKTLKDYGHEILIECPSIVSELVVEFVTSD
ncbi:hypothetical protein RCL1_002189 [Eukaryota sp. TZLM3-RCL]